MAIAVVLGCWACWAGVVTYLINGRKSASLVALAKSAALPRSDRAWIGLGIVGEEVSKIRQP